MKKINLFLFIIFIFVLFASMSCKKDKLTMTNPISNKVETLKGTVLLTYSQKGTPVEMSFFVLDRKCGKDIYLFGERSRSIGFEEYVDRKVKVTGNRSLGYIGCLEILVGGFLVRDVTVDK